MPHSTIINCLVFGTIAIVFILFFLDWVYYNTDIGKRWIQRNVKEEVHWLYTMNKDGRTAICLNVNPDGGAVVACPIWVRRHLEWRRDVDISNYGITGFSVRDRVNESFNLKENMSASMLIRESRTRVILEINWDEYHSNVGAV